MSAALCIDSFLHYLVLEPRQPVNSCQMTIAPELHELVKRKMLNQESHLRAAMDIIKWQVPDDPTIRALFGNQPLEEVGI